MPTTRHNSPLLVIKFGGAAMKNESRARALFTELRALQEGDVRVVLIHGGGPEIDSTLLLMGVTPKKIDGLRVTDAATLEVVEMVLCGKVNKALVTLAAECGVRGVGLSGVDGELALARKKKAHVDLGYVGEVTEVRREIIDTLVDASFLPIISSVATSSDGTHYNVNGDDFASAIASALNADHFLLITDVPGIMSEYPKRESVITRLPLADAEVLANSGKIAAGMIPKIAACTSAVRAGVRRACITDGEAEGFIAKFLNGSNDFGTTISR